MYVCMYMYMVSITSCVSLPDEHVSGPVGVEVRGQQQRGGYAGHVVRQAPARAIHGTHRKGFFSGRPRPKTLPLPREEGFKKILNVFFIHVYKCMYV